MEKRRFSWIMFLLLCNLFHLQAQWDDPPGQYRTIKGYFNPSFAGSTEDIGTAALYRYAWSGIKNAPQQLYVTSAMPLELFGRRQGAGLILFTETIGQLRNGLLAAQYCFRKETDKGYLNFGLQAGIYALQFDTDSKSIFPDSLQYGHDILKVNRTDKQLFDLNAGISWTGRSLFVGLAVMHLTQPRFYSVNDSLSTGLRPDSISSVVSRSYNFMAGYNIRLFRSLEIEPMLWLQTDLNKIQVQATLRMEYNKKISGGIAWRSDDGYWFFAGTTIRGIVLGYGYGLHTAGPGKKSNGSHEICLSYNFPLDYFKPKRQPHKSIRLL